MRLDYEYSDALEFPLARFPPLERVNQSRFSFLTMFVLTVALNSE